MGALKKRYNHEVTKRKSNFEEPVQLSSNLINLPSLHEINQAKSFPGSALIQNTNDFAAATSHVSSSGDASSNYDRINVLWNQVKILAKKQEELQQMQRDMEDDQNQLMQQFQQMVTSALLDTSLNNRSVSSYDDESHLIRFLQRRRMDN